MRHSAPSATSLSRRTDLPVARETQRLTLRVEGTGDGVAVAGEALGPVGHEEAADLHHAVDVVVVS